MAVKEYSTMSLEERKMLFAAKLLPIGDALEFWRLFLMPYDGPKFTTPELAAELGEQWHMFQKMDKVRLTLGDLRAIVREADRDKWWPTKDSLSRHLHFQERRISAWRAEDILQKILDTVALTRAIVLGEASALGAVDPVQARERMRIDHEAFVAAVSLAMGVLTEEPQWDGIAATDAGHRLLEEWLRQAIFIGAETKEALECLRHQFASYVSYDERDRAQLERLYCSHCTWRGWRDGLEIPAFAESSFAQGCCRLLAGDLAGAHKLLFKFGDEGYKGDFATSLLIHAVCMAVRPSITRAVKIFRGSSCHSMEHYDAETLAQVVAVRNRNADVVEVWNRQWGANGALVITGFYNSEPNVCRLDGIMRLAWDWHSKGELERAAMREGAGGFLPFVATVVRNGYVNIGGLFLSLMPEMGAEPKAAPILDAMRKNGTWILPYEEPKPIWSQFLVSLRNALGVVTKKQVEAKSEKVSEALPRGRVVWEVWGHASEDGYVALEAVEPFFREQLSDGTEKSVPIRLEKLSSEKYRAFVSVHDLALASKLLACESWERSVTPDIADDFIQMSNLELVEYVRDGHLKRRTPITIEVRPCTMSTSVAADGSTVLSLPAWRRGNRFAFMRTERPGVLAYLKLDESRQRLAQLFEAYGKDGKIVLPPDAAAVNGDVLEKLTEVLPAERRESVQEESLPEVKTRADCVVRLEFDEGCLNIHALTRPLKENAELLFEPGFGSEKRQVEGKGGSYVFVRNLAAERERFLPIRNTLSDFGTWFNGRSSWSIGDVGDAIAALDRLQSMKPRLVLEWNKDKKLNLSRPRLKITSSGERRGWFDVTGTFTVDDGKVYDILELLNALRTNGGAGEYVQLTSGEYVLLTREIRRQLGALAEVGREEKGKIRIPRGAIPFLSSMFGGEGISLPAAMAKAAEKVRTALAEEPEVPKTLAAQLRPYQIEGYRWLSRLASCGFGSCLADDMGLGKTLQTIALLLERAKDGASLVVAPASVCGNWRNEIRRFAPTLEPIVAMEEDEEAIEKAGPRSIVIASYGYLLFHEALFRGIAWNGVVLDEAQAIKNADAKRTKLVKEFKANFRVAATGTPVENRLEELWSIFDFLDTGLLGTREAFLERGVASVKPIVKPLILRRLKGEVLEDLPQKTEVTRFVELSIEERSAYEACRLKAQNDFATADKKKRMGMLLAGLTRLRRFCCNPSLVLGKDAVGSAKIDALAELMDELREGGHRALVFSQFTDYLAIVRKMVTDKGWSAQYLDGETPLKDRGRRVDAFQNGEGDFFLISLKAGGTGLNLTSADYVIILDPWWNPAVENQAADRAHRIGQHRPVTIYRLIAKDTVEERVLDLHHEKLQLSAEILDDTASAKLTSDQLIGLLK